MVACAACGSESPAGQKFCGECGAPVAGGAPRPAADAVPATERRLVSVLFADLVGFTSLSESRDAEEVRELLSRYFDTCRRLIELYGGTVEKFIGDAVMAVWGTPVATEDDAERAVRAALDLVTAVSALGDELAAPGLRARAGVLTGEAAVVVGAVGQGMVAGDLVNTASRLQTAAEPGTVLVGEATRRASESAIAYEAAGVHTLKGKDEPVPLWRALRVVSGVRGQLRSEGLEAPFVGRESELRRIKELYHACAAERRAQLVSVTGTAGIGKSRLAWEFYKYFDGIVEPVLWHRGRCPAYGEGVAYWALAEMVRMRCRIAEDERGESAAAKLRATLAEHVPDEEERRFVEPRLARLLGLGLGDGDDAERQDLFAGWRLFFERLADAGVVVLVFEDLQWADASLLDFVEYLLEWSRSHGLFVVTLARPDLLERRPTWGARQRAFTSLHLEPLPEAAMRELLAGLVPGLPEEVGGRILTRAEGIPLYAVETVRMLLDRGLLVHDGPSYAPAGEIETLEVPETLHALIASRLDGLSETERRLLQDASVLGESFTRRALAAVAGRPEAELEQLLASLVRKEVLGVQLDPRSPEHGQYGFLQDLVRRVAYETLSRRERRNRHLAAAEQLAAGLGEEDAAEVVAAHLLAAYREQPDADDADELRTRAAAALARAAERAGALGAAAEAQRYLEQAAGLTDDPLARAALVADAGSMAWRAARPGEARALLEQARAAYLEGDEARAAAQVTSRLAEVDYFDGRMLEAIARLTEALTALEEGEPDADLAAASAQLGRFLALTGEYARAAPYLERAALLAETLGLPETLAQVLNSRAVLVSFQGRVYEALVLTRGALDLALRHELNGVALRSYNNLAVFLEAVDGWRDVRATKRRALELARRVGDRTWEAMFLSPRFDVQLGDWEEGLAAFAAAAELSDTVYTRGAPISVLMILCERGELEEARRVHERHLETLDPDDPQWVYSVSLGEARLRRAEGRPAEALDAARRALATELGSLTADPLYEAIEAALALGDEQLARELLEDYRRITVRPSVRGHAARFRARLAGPDEDADAAFAEAERVFRELEASFALAVSALEHAEWLVGAGRHGEAEQLLAEARSIFEELGARPWLGRLAAVEATAPPAGVVPS